MQRSPGDTQIARESSNQATTSAPGHPTQQQDLNSKAPEDHRGHANSDRLSKPSDDISPGAPNIATRSAFQDAGDTQNA